MGAIIHVSSHAAGEKSSFIIELIKRRFASNIDDGCGVESSYIWTTESLLIRRLLRNDNKKVQLQSTTNSSSSSSSFFQQQEEDQPVQENEGKLFDNDNNDDDDDHHDEDHHDKKTSSSSSSLNRKRCWRVGLTIWDLGSVTRSLHATASDDIDTFPPIGWLLYLYVESRSIFI